MEIVSRERIEAALRAAGFQSWNEIEFDDDGYSGTTQIRVYAELGMSSNLGSTRSMRVCVPLWEPNQPWQTSRSEWRRRSDFTGS